MSLEENKSIVRRVVEEAQSRGDMRVVDELFSPDFVDHNAFPGVPPTRKGVQMVFSMFLAAFPDLRATIHEQIAEGDKVMTRKTLSGTHRGDFLGMPATGKHVDIAVIDILRIVDRQITDHWNIVDQIGLLQQLGAMPA
jgi:steroid delta-isomerase-like uncharacterized protein